MGSFPLYLFSCALSHCLCVLADMTSARSVGSLTGFTRQPHSLVFKAAAYSLQQYFTGFTRVPHLIVVISFRSGGCSTPMKGFLFTAHWFASNFQLVPFPHSILAWDVLICVYRISTQTQIIGCAVEWHNSLGPTSSPSDYISESRRDALRVWRYATRALDLPVVHARHCQVYFTDLDSFCI